MKARQFLLTLLLVIFTAGTALAEGPVAVIVNKDNPTPMLSEQEIKRIYTNGVLSWPDGAPITMYDLSTQSPVRAEFSEKVLGKDPDRVAEEWAHLKITNQAKNPPQTMKSETLIIRRVAKEKGAIGYVSLGSARNNADVRVINTLQ